MTAGLGTAIWAAVKGSRLLQIGLIALAGLGGFKGWLYAHDKGTAKQVAVQIGHANTKLAAKGGDARKPAAAPGSVERLRAKYCEGACK